MVIQFCDSMALFNSTPNNKVKEVTECCLLIKFEDDTKLGRAADMLEGKVVIQRDLDVLEK